MPEGDTVWRAARLLDRALTGSVLTATDFRVPAFATWDLSGATVSETVSRGKHLLTRIDGDARWTLHTHLKMEGGWRVLRPGARWPRPAHTARVVLTTADTVAVGFALGLVEIVPRDREPDLVGHLGPDLLGPDWDPDEAVRRLREQPDRTIKEALLDQTRLAGIGNMYAAELCFVTGVAPETTGGRRARPPTHGRPRPPAARPQQPPRPAEHDRRPGPRATVLGLRPSRPALPTLRYDDPTVAARRRGPRADDVRLPDVPDLGAAARRRPEPRHQVVRSQGDDHARRHGGGGDQEPSSSS